MSKKTQDQKNLDYENSKLYKRISNSIVFGKLRNNTDVEELIRARNEIERLLKKGENVCEKHRKELEELDKYLEELNVQKELKT